MGQQVVAGPSPQHSSSTTHVPASSADQKSTSSSSSTAPELASSTTQYWCLLQPTAFLITTRPGRQVQQRMHFTAGSPAARRLTPQHTTTQSLLLQLASSRYWRDWSQCGLPQWCCTSCDATQPMPPAVSTLSWPAAGSLQQSAAAAVQSAAAAVKQQQDSTNMEQLDAAAAA